MLLADTIYTVIFSLRVSLRAIFAVTRVTRHNYRGNAQLEGASVSRVSIYATNIHVGKSHQLSLRSNCKVKHKTVQSMNQIVVRKLLEKRRDRWGSYLVTNPP